MHCKQHEAQFKLSFNNAKLKATTARLNILEIFFHEEKPLSVLDVKKKVGSKIDLVTLYRNIEILENLGILTKVFFGGGKNLYEFASKHHHHLACTNCGKVVDVELCIAESLIPKILKKSGFYKIEKHSLEYFGLCQNCKGKNL